ncbi:MAG: PorV/PorQ family protein [Candidatus Cloacimonetes bacterium]|nr:PorV/PorQ family protein [Candidatus Cloacimonadota bacterium]
MSYKFITIAIIIFMAFTVTLSAVSNAAPIFLLIEPGSRPGAMGSAYVAMVDDAFAGYWNTGAMAFNRKVQFALMHSNWFGDVMGINDMYIEYLAWNEYFEDIGNVGANATFMTYGSQDMTDEDGLKIGTFTSYELAIALSYAYQMNQNLGLGVNFKFIYSDLAPEGTGETEHSTKGQGMSFAFDFGYLQKNFFVRNLSFGVNFQNIGPNITYINKSQADPLPLNLRAGFSYRIIDTQYSKFAINGDMSKVLANEDDLFTRMITAWHDDPIKYEWEEIVKCIGAEYIYLDLLSIRSGYYLDTAGEIEGFSFGAGIHYTVNNQYKLGIDFAMQPAGELTKWNKTFSLNVEF